MAAGFQRILIKHARIPGTQALSPHVLDLVSYGKTIARGAYVGTDTATETLGCHFLPVVIICETFPESLCASREVKISDSMLRGFLNNLPCLRFLMLRWSISQGVNEGLSFLS